MHLLHSSHPKVTSIVNKSQRARKNERKLKSNESVEIIASMILFRIMQLSFGFEQQLVFIMHNKHTQKTLVNSRREGGEIKLYYIHTLLTNVIPNGNR